MLIVPAGGESRKDPVSPFRMRLIGAAKDARVLEGTPLTATANYLLGPKASWRTGVPLFADARFQNVYAGIDVVYHGRGGQLEFDFIVGPGSDPSQIVLAAGPENRLQLDEGQGLILSSNAQSIRIGTPNAFQGDGANRTAVDCEYRILESGFGFELGEYDRSRPLIIDPIVELSTYVGVPSADARGVGVDSEGNIYVSGMTTSPDFNLGGTHFDEQLDGESDMFVVKFNPDASEVIYATYIGGSDKDSAKCMFVDREGCVYLGGNTKSTDLPTKGYIEYYGPTYDFCVVKVNKAGNGLDYCCVFGGESMEEIRGITVDSIGNCIAVGGSHSPDLPTTADAYQPRYTDPPEETPEKAGSFMQGEDAVIAKINPTGSDFVFCTWLGGRGFEKAWAVTTNRADEIFVAGHVEALDFPVSPGAFQTKHGGGIPRPDDQYGPKDAFVAKLSADGRQLLTATYFGGSGQDVGYGIGVDGTGDVYLAGNTESADIPLSENAHSIFSGGGTDVFLARFDADLTQLRFSTCFGGSGKDEISSNTLVVDEAGYSLFAGGTDSALTLGADAFLDAFQGGSSDGYLARFAPSGALSYATYLGGSGSDQCGAIAIDARGGAYVAGRTDSSDFALQNAHRNERSGGRDAFVVKIAFPR